MNYRRACLHHLVPDLSAAPRTVKRYRGHRDGGGGLVDRPVLVSSGAELALTGDGIRIRFTKDGGFVEGDVTAIDLPEDWEDAGVLEVAVENGPAALTFTCTLLGARGRLITSAHLAANEASTVRLDLRDLPLAQGIQRLYEPSAIRLQAQWGATWPSEGAVLINQGWPLTDHNDPVSLTVHEIRLLPCDPAASRAVVDRFGQRRNTDWPGKVRSIEDLHRNRDQESRQAPLLQRTRFGGNPNVPPLAATGFFRVEQEENGRWWLIDPEGYRFWSVGTTGVRLLDTTVTEGREFLFEELPDPDGPYAAALTPAVNSPANDPNGRATVAFYYWNVLRKYGDRANWRDQVLDRFDAWGFNTLGNWSEPFMLDQELIAHTRALSTALPRTARVGARLPDVWDAEWQIAFQDYLRHEVTPVRDNPWLLGFFVDNELPWGNLRDELPRCSPGSAAKREWVGFVQRNVPDLGTFNRWFRTHFQDWAGVQAHTFGVLPTSGPGFDLLCQAAGFYAETYFQTVSALLKHHAPHHLYLGCRFVRRKPDDLICQAAGRYCDVVTVNSYDLWPRREEFEIWYRAVGGKPILIGEHHLPLTTERQLPPLYPCFTREERGVLYKELVQKWASQPWAVGCHWYQHADQHITGRPVDGENQPVGFVDITDTPHPELVDAAREATLHMYDWHAASS